MYHPKTIFGIMTIILSFVFLIGSGNAQDTDPSPTPSPTPMSEEEAELEKDIKLLEKKKAKIKLEDEIRDLQVPSDVTPLKGDASGTDDMFMEVEMQSYKAARIVTDRIACDVKSLETQPEIIILYSPEQYDIWRSYKLLNPILEAELTDLKSLYDKHLATGVDANPSMIPGLGVIADVTGAVKAFAGLVAFLRSDVSFKAKAIDINEAALRAGVIRSFSEIYKKLKDESRCSTAKAKTVPGIYDPSVFTPVTSTTSPVLERIKALYLQKALADEAIRVYDILLAEIEDAKVKQTKAKEVLTAIKVIIETRPDLITSLSSEIRKEKDPKKRKELIAARDEAAKSLAKAKLELNDATKDFNDLKKERENLESQLTPTLKVKIGGLRRANTEFVEFLSRFTKPNDPAGISPLAQYVEAETLNGITKGKTFWMEIKAVKAGGNNRVRKSLVRYFWGPDISHSGGFIAEYRLANEGGKIVLSNSDGQYEKYRKASSIQK